jgi:hypothetical protein
VAKNIGKFFHIRFMKFATRQYMLNFNQIYRGKNMNTKMTFIISALVLASFNSLAQEAAFDDTKELTLEQEQASETYIHQGQAQKKSFEMCKDGQGGFKDICTENKNAFDGGMNKTIEALLPVVTKAYSMIMMVSGSKVQGNKLDSNDNQMYKSPDGGDPYTPKDGKPNVGDEKATTEKTDFCQYIPMAGEAINLVMAKNDNDVSQTNYEKAKPEAKQAASFYTLAKTHKNQEKASKMQFTVWGATAGCYTALVATSYVNPDWKLYAKLGGSALIAAFYKKKANAHKKRAKTLEEMAKKLPQGGDCNPFTETSCFCNEDSSYAVDTKNYMDFCVPKPLVARNKNNDASYCVDSKGKADPDCSCAAQNTCIDRTLKAGALAFDINPLMMKDPLSGLKPLSTGFGTGNLNPANRSLAAARKALKKYSPNGPINLNKNQKKLASAFNKMGIPRGAAAMMAKRSGSGSGGKLPRSFTAGSDNKMASIRSTGGDAKAIASKYESGGSAGGKASKSRNRFSRFKKKSRKKGSSIKIDDDYIKRATREAEITQNTEVSIFKVINNRYQLSAWREFPTSLDDSKANATSDK